MSLIIGIDVGISSTKIIGIENGKRIKTPMSVTGSDSISSLYGALGKYLHDNEIPLESVEHIMVTGIGARNIKSPILDVMTTYVDEFIANGLGARFDIGLDHMVVVSMGTGTSLVLVDGDDIKHIGGIAMGGGTLQGLCKLLLNTTDIDAVADLAEEGYTSRTTMVIGDVCKEGIEGLPPYATASLLGNVIHNNPTREDIAAGIIHMVLETIGSCAVLSQQNSNVKDFVLIGRLSQLKTFSYVFTNLGTLYNVRFHTPKYASYCTALGAALSYQYQTD